MGPMEQGNGLSSDLHGDTKPPREKIRQNLGLLGEIQCGALADLPVRLHESPRLSVHFRCGQENVDRPRVCFEVTLEPEDAILENKPLMFATFGANDVPRPVGDAKRILMPMKGHKLFRKDIGNREIAVDTFDQMPTDFGVFVTTHGCAKRRSNNL